MDAPLAQQLAERANRAKHPVVLIDGGSGAGKTELAQQLVALMAPRTQLVSLDSCYPGWHGLRAGSDMVPGMLIGPEPGYWTWDWKRNSRGVWCRLDPRQPLVIEGCGALTAESAHRSSLRVWLDLDDETRRTRALDRDGENYEPWWEIWAEQEHQHWRRDQPWTLADVTIDVAEQTLRDLHGSDLRVGLGDED